MSALAGKPAEFNMFLGAITGNTLGTLFEGLPKQHIHACIREIKEYPDPAPLLKSKMDRWSKPGLYSCLSQMMIIAAACHDGRLFRKDAFIDIISRSQSVHETNTGIFRHAGPIEKNLITELKGVRAPDRTPDHISGRIIPLSLALVPRGVDSVRDTLNLALVFTRNPDTAAATLLFSGGVRALISNPGKPAKRAFTDEAETILRQADRLSPVIFSMGLNPEAVISGIDWLKNTIAQTINSSSGEAEMIIRDRVNPLLKTPVTRATIDDPRCILPYSLSIAECPSIDSESKIIHAATEGGSSSALAMMCGALTGIMYGADAIPEFLIQGLVNRGRIIEILDLLSSGNGNRIAVDDFLKGEYSLAIKEQEELNARLKHIRKPVKPSGEKTRQKKENTLTRHTVESWTKLDKARWKKNKQNRDDDQD